MVNYAVGVFGTCGIVFLLMTDRKSTVKRERKER
jgi:hypothetical protein